MTDAAGIWTPADIDPVTFAFPANVKKLMPAYDKLPSEYKRRYDEPKSIKLVNRWFFKGLPENLKIVFNPGIDGEKALRHLTAIMHSFQPKHEHKVAAVAWLIDQWFERFEVPDEP